MAPDLTEFSYLQSQSKIDIEHFDVVIVGAGLSGLCAAYYLKKYCPTKTFVIVEARQALGGTWDLFRYPGIRSDSDLYTFGFSFAPWDGEKAIADGPAILEYLRETAARFELDRAIRLQEKVIAANFETAQARWTLHVADGASAGTLKRYTCGLLYLCTGYYDYEAGYCPSWPDMAAFQGKIVHPQQWPQDLVYQDKRVIVIGSGATAVTLVPALAKQAAHVTLLQRSPTYIVAVSSKDAAAAWLKRHASRLLAHKLARWKNILLALFLFTQARAFPTLFARKILDRARAKLPHDFDIARHLTPRYKPWDQRLCLVPSGDLFRALSTDRATIVTDEIARFTKHGIETASGEKLEADLIVTATGLTMKLGGGMALMIDGEPVCLSKTFFYKGVMLSGVPNLVYAFGYTNASWTLKCELTARFACRLLKFMDKRGYRTVTPRMPHQIAAQPFMGLNSGYVQRAAPHLPSQGKKRPWKVYQNYLLDLLALKFGPLRNSALDFACLPSSEANRD